MFVLEDKYSTFHKTFDRRFAKFVVNFISLLRTWEFHYVTVNQMENFETNLGNFAPNFVRMNTEHSCPRKLLNTGKVYFHFQEPVIPVE